MYSLIGGALFVVLGAAFVCALFGWLSFEPLALVASTLVFSLTGVAASYGLGRLYGAPSHLQSALITASILACLFTPTTDATTLLQYVLISVIAQASKYVVTYKRRHIFNPAAFGAFIGGLLSLSYASWWVATPALAAIVAAMAFVVLYKTRQLLLGAVFIVVSVALIATRGVADGETLGYMVSTALTSWPLLFIAGFMLSEPLTLPPKKWQKLTVGAVVAVLVSLPFHLGWFDSSPQFALLIGNITAFALAFRQRGGLRLKLAKRRKLTPTTEEYVFTTNTPVVFDPGQYIELTLPGLPQDVRGARRMFSITSNPGENNISLGIKFSPKSSTFKNTLQKLPIGSVVQTTGVSGEFLLPKNTNQKLLFIAGGIGVTPFVSQLALCKAQQRDAILLYFADNPKEFAYKDQLDAYSTKVIYFVANGATAGYIQAVRLTDDILHTYVGDASERAAYISGPPAMVAAVKNQLRRKVRSIHTDYFAGY